MRAHPGRRQKHRDRRGTEPTLAPRRRRWLPALLGGAVLLAALLFGIARWRSGLPPDSRLARASADPAAGMSVADAAAMAARLYRENRAAESLPYYRRVSPEMAPGRLDFRLEFASALQNASLQARASSRDRVQMLLEGLDQLAIAERNGTRPRERARVIVARAFFLKIWGFPMDALAELHRAIATDPSYPELPATAQMMESWLRDPTLSLEAIERGAAKRIPY